MPGDWPGMSGTSLTAASGGSSAWTLGSVAGSNSPRSQRRTFMVAAGCPGAISVGSGSRSGLPSRASPHGLSASPRRAPSVSGLRRTDKASGSDSIWFFRRSSRRKACKRANVYGTVAIRHRTAAICSRERSIASGERSATRVPEQSIDRRPVRPASGDRSATCVSAQFRRWRLTTPDRGERSATPVPHKSSVCRSRRPRSGETSATLVWMHLIV